MSTRSTIWIKNDDDSFTGVYCHFDGYLDGVGATLKTYYTDKEKVLELIGLGSLSVLESSLEKTTAYHRDRGEDFTQLKANDLRDTCRKSEEWQYFFIDNKWYYINSSDYTEKDLKEL